MAPEFEIPPVADSVAVPEEIYELKELAKDPAELKSYETEVFASAERSDKVNEEAIIAKLIMTLIKAFFLIFMFVRECLLRFVFLDYRFIKN